jgi:hypothetical protein
MNTNPSIYDVLVALSVQSSVAISCKFNKQEQDDYIRLLERNLLNIKEITKFPDGECRMLIVDTVPSGTDNGIL